MSDSEVRPSDGVAIHPSDDVVLLGARIAKAHSTFVETAATARDIRRMVFESWSRSKRAAVDPDRAAPNVLTDTEFEEYRAAHPMALVRPLIENLLVEDASEAGLLIAISDAGGRLLWVEGNSRARDRALSINFAEGADWSERAVGTNAPGTALALDHCVQIFGAEHFSRSVHEWSCTAAPIHDPNTGRILGAVDITGGPRVAVPEVLALVRATVSAAESELRYRLRDHPMLLGANRPRLVVLGPHAELVRGSERMALSPRHAEILLLLSEHPEGLTAEQLAVLLDEVDLDAVTVRAEMSRLRRVFGGDGLSSRPYRVSRELRTDVADVRDALARGDIARASTIYSGPVLPRSAAPGVYRVREELRAQMHAALVRQRDPGLLAAWTQTVDGRDDVGAWHAYLATLDRQDPRYSQVRARIAVLDCTFG